MSQTTAASISNGITRCNESEGCIGLSISSTPDDNPTAETQEASKQEANESHSRENESAEEDTSDDGFRDLHTAR